MWPNPQDIAGLVTFMEEILNGKLHFLYSAKKAFYAVIVSFCVLELQFCEVE